MVNIVFTVLIILIGLQQYNKTKQREFEQQAWKFLLEYKNKYDQYNNGKHDEYWIADYAITYSEAIYNIRWRRMRDSSWHNTLSSILSEFDSSDCFKNHPTGNFSDKFINSFLRDNNFAIYEEISGKDSDCN